MNRLFSHFARWVERQTGRPGAFVLAFAVVLVWGATGPLFHFSDTWQLVINTGTTIVTFLMVFIIQNAQNRDTEAIHLKLDELIRVTTARNGMIDLEERSDEEMDEVKRDFDRLAAAAAHTLAKTIDEKVEQAVEDEVNEALSKRGLGAGDAG